MDDFLEWYNGQKNIILSLFLKLHLQAENLMIARGDPIREMGSSLEIHILVAMEILEEKFRIYKKFRIYYMFP